MKGNYKARAIKRVDRSCDYIEKAIEMLSKLASDEPRGDDTIYNIAIKSVRQLQNIQHDISDIIIKYKYLP